MYAKDHETRQLCKKEKRLTRNSAWNSSAQSGDGGPCDLISSWLSSLVAHSSGAHVWFQQSSLQVHVVVAQCLVASGQNGLSHLHASVQIVVTIGQNLWLNNWNNALRLANGCITGQNVGVLHNCLVAGGVLANLQHATPLGEVATVFLVLSATRSQVVQTCKNKITFCYLIINFKNHLIKASVKSDF